jgi:hypothetical protein
MGKKFLSVVFHSRTDVEGKDTMGMGRPLGMSTIIKSIPTAVPCNPLKAQALSNLCYTIQTTFSMILIAKLEHYHHEAMEKKREEYHLQKGLYIHPFLGEGTMQPMVCINGQ